MSFFKRIWKSLSSGDAVVAGGDPEAEAILTEEYGAGDPDVPLERPTDGGPIGRLPGPTQAGIGEVGGAAHDAEHATDEPADPAP
ncbi:MAG: hypothetical protein ACXVRK_07390 [Gaiellaceae bacterium]